MKIGQRVKVKSLTRGNHSEEIIGMVGKVAKERYESGPSADWMFIDFGVRTPRFHTGNILLTPTGYWIPPEDLSCEVELVSEILERYEM